MEWSAKTITFNEYNMVASLHFNRDLNDKFHLNHEDSKPVIAHNYPDYEFDSTERIVPGALTLTGLERFLIEQKNNNLVAGFVVSFPKPAVLKQGEVKIRYKFKPTERIGAAINCKIHSAHSVHPANRKDKNSHFTERNLKGTVLIYDRLNESAIYLQTNGIDYDDSQKEDMLKNIINRKNMILFDDPEHPGKKIYNLESILGKKQKETYITDADGKQRLVLPEAKGLFSGKKPVVVLDDAYGNLKGVYLRNKKVHNVETYEFDYGVLHEGLLNVFCLSIGISKEEYIKKYGEFLCPSLCSSLLIPAYGNFIKQEKRRWISDAKKSLDADEDTLQASGIFTRQSLVSDLRHLPKVGSDITVFVTYQNKPNARVRKGNYMTRSQVSAIIFDEIGRPAVAGTASFLGYVSKKQ